jgi:hypothetical protein
MLKQPFTPIGSAATITALALLIAAPAQAIMVININEVGADLVINGSGTIDTSGLTQALGDPSASAGILVAKIATFGFGPVRSDALTDAFQGLNGPTSLASTLVSLFGGTAVHSGDTFAINGALGSVYLPAGYVSGTPLTGATTFSNQSFSSALLTPGNSYTWTWGAGAHADSVIVNVGVTAVPEPQACALMLLGLVALRVMNRRAAV